MTMLFLKYIFFALFLFACNNPATEDDKLSHLRSEDSFCYESVFIYPKELDAPLYYHLTQIANLNKVESITLHLISETELGHWIEQMSDSPCQWNFFTAFSYLKELQNIPLSRINHVSSIGLEEKEEQKLQEIFKEAYLENPNPDSDTFFNDSKAISFILKHFTKKPMYHFDERFRTSLFQGTVKKETNLQFQVLNKNPKLDKKGYFFSKTGNIKGIVFSPNEILELNVKQETLPIRNFFIVNQASSFVFYQLKQHPSQLLFHSWDSPIPSNIFNSICSALPEKEKAFCHQNPSVQHLAIGNLLDNTWNEKLKQLSIQASLPQDFSLNINQRTLKIQFETTFHFFSNKEAREDSFLL